MRWNEKTEVATNNTGETNDTRASGKRGCWPREGREEE